MIHETIMSEFFRQVDKDMKLPHQLKNLIAFNNTHAKITRRYNCIADWRKARCWPEPPPGPPRSAPRTSTASITLIWLILFHRRPRCSGSTRCTPPLRLSPNCNKPFKILWRPEPRGRGRPRRRTGTIWTWARCSGSHRRLRWLLFTGPRPLPPPAIPAAPATQVILSVKVKINDELCYPFSFIRGQTTTCLSVRDKGNLRRF